jgi:hypothetical protein
MPGLQGAPHSSALTVLRWRRCRRGRIRRSLLSRLFRLPVQDRGRTDWSGRPRHATLRCWRRSAAAGPANGPKSRRRGSPALQEFGEAAEPPRVACQPQGCEQRERRRRKEQHESKPSLIPESVRRELRQAAQHRSYQVAPKPGAHGFPQPPPERAAPILPRAAIACTGNDAARWLSSVGLVPAPTAPRLETAGCTGGMVAERHMAQSRIEAGKTPPSQHLIGAMSIILFIFRS